MIFVISFNRFSDVLPAFTCANAIGNLCSICLGVNILNCVQSKTLRTETLAMGAKSKGCKSNILGHPFPFLLFEMFHF